MSSFAIITESVVALIAVGVAVGAPLIGMRLQRRESRRAPVAATGAARPSRRDDLPVAA